jgi:hypothetical protein
MLIADSCELPVKEERTTAIAPRKVDLLQVAHGFSPKPGHAVGIEQRIDADDGQSIPLGVNDNHPVERAMQLTAYSYQLSAGLDG